MRAEQCTTRDPIIAPERAPDHDPPIRLHHHIIHHAADTMARVENGMPYIGSSAGSNVAGPTIRTTNDMPIVEPPSLNALGLVPFQINPHYLDPDPGSTHMGETREERILQFLEENETPVVGLREGAMLRVEEGRAMLKGSTGARIFRKGQPPVEVLPGSDLRDVISGS